MDTSIFNFFAKYIEQELGIIYNDLNEGALEKRLEEIKEILQLASVEELYQVCSKSGIFGHTKQLILDIATNNETLFFRDKKAFEMLREYIFPEILKRKNNITVRSLACSYGQEPYSIAMVLDELRQTEQFSSSIDASDISNRALEYAKQGKYSQLQVQRGLSSKYLVKYFSKDSADYWSVSPTLSNQINFFERNLLELNQERHKYDVILCRYVLIYQDTERKKKILDDIYKMLNPGGYLLLGGSESMIGLSKTYHEERYEGAICYRKEL